MDGETYIAQLTVEEQAELVKEIGARSVAIVMQSEQHTWTPEGVNILARNIIEAREPKIDVRYAMFSRKHGVEIADGARLSRVYFPTEESRDEGVRRATRAAMEYSLWVQLYPNGFRIEEDARVYVIDGSDNVVSGGWAYGARIFDGKTLCVYATKADAQRVADILKREGV